MEPGPDGVGDYGNFNDDTLFEHAGESSLTKVQHDMARCGNACILLVPCSADFMFAEEVQPCGRLS